MLCSKSESSARLLVVEDDPAMQRYIQAALEGAGHCVEVASGGADALQRVHRQPAPDVVILDMLLPDLDGLQILKQLRQINPALKIIMLSCVCDSRKVVEAIRLGAADYLSKPFHQHDLDSALQPLLAARSSQTNPTREVIEDVGGGVFFVTATAELNRLRAQAELIAQVDIPVLILGESGTGKEVFARILHQASPRAHGPFLKVNCAAVPEDLLESELFGYEPGAFTGATQAKPGKFELSQRGTILLDEIGEMPPALQAKLLHVLQDGQFSRLGGRCVIKADVRVVAATNVEISQALAARRLREDLYYRLSGFTLRLPPLRERPADVALLLRYFMRSLAERFACPVLPISQPVLDACMAYSWPGNVRELENFVKRCLVLQEFTSPGSDPGSAGRRSGWQPNTTPAGAGVRELKSLARSARGDAEMQAILQALRQTNWNRKQAAARLKISYKALLYKIREYEIRPAPAPIG